MNDRNPPYVGPMLGKFDFQAERQRLIEWQRGLFGAMVFIPLFLTLIGIWLGWSLFGQAEGFGWLTFKGASFIGVELGIGGVALYLALGVLSNRAGAISLVLEPDGIDLLYGPHSHEAYHWDRKGDRFFLQDYSDFSPVSERGIRYIAKGPHLWSRGSLISETAFKALLRAAAEFGADVTSRQTGRWSLMGPNVLVYQIQGRRRKRLS